jgi:hypothetical protein
LYRPAGLKPVWQICDFPIIPVCCATQRPRFALNRLRHNDFCLNP